MSSAIDAVPQRIRTLWQRMTECYGHRWTSAYGEDAAAGAGLTWAKGLASVTSGQLAAGIAAAIASADPWPPTLPAFRAMCLGIPSFAAVRREITGKTEIRSPFARQVWEFLDGYLYARADADKADRMLRDAWSLAADYVMRGGHLPEPIAGELAAPEKRKPKPASEETVKASLAQIAELLGSSDETEDE